MADTILIGKGIEMMPILIL